MQAATFDDFALDPRLVKAIHAQGFERPTPVQAAVIPSALAGGDLVAIAQTGTGKTLAYALPALHRLANLPKKGNRMLVLSPTRELTVQVHSVLETFGSFVRIRCACVYGGVGYEPQMEAFRRESAVVVATPGRLLDHMGRGNVRFDDLAILVLDEADRMLDMGFLPDIERILRKVSEDRQTILCSATFPDEIARLSQRFLRDPERIAVGSVAQPVDSVRQIVYTVQQAGKIGLLEKLLREEAIGSALVFLRTKHRTDTVADSLHRLGFKAKALHGDRTQRQREQALEGFRDGKYRILVATDVAARGLDIEGISHVINYDVPENADDYLHRIGRTARANAEGDAVTFVSPDETVALESIERSLGRNLPRREWEGAVPVLSLFHETPDKSFRSRHRRQRGLLRR